MSTLTLVGSRDASWYDRPNMRAPKRLHRIIGGMAACNRRVPLDEFSYTATDLVDPASLCRRCFRPPNLNHQGGRAADPERASTILPTPPGVVGEVPGSVAAAANNPTS